MRDRRPPPPEPYDASKDDEYSNRELEALADQMLRDGAKAINPDTGKERGIGGKDPILFAEHEYSRKRREIYCTEGTPDPSLVSGIYNRCHPQGRKVNTPEQRRVNGASWYRVHCLLPVIGFTSGGEHLQREESDEPGGVGGISA